MRRTERGDRGRRWTARAVGVTFAVGVSLVVDGSPALADHCDLESLSGFLIGDNDLPGGFEPVPDVTGELDPELLGTLAPGEDVSAFEQICGYVRVWADAAGVSVQATVFELSSDTEASELFSGITASAESRALTSFDVAEVPNAEAFVLEGRAPPNTPGRTSVSLIRSGHYVFLIAVGASEADQVTVGRLTEAQAESAPSGSEGADDAVGPSSSGARTSGAVFALVTIYVLGVTALARLRDPLRADRRGVRGTAPVTAIDVSAVSHQTRQMAEINFASQLYGLSLLLVGALPAFWPGSLSTAAIGAALVLRLPSRAWRRVKGLPRPGGRSTARRGSVRAAVLRAVALALYLAGAMPVVAAASWVQSDRPRVLHTSDGEHLVLDGGLQGILALLYLGIAIVAVALAVAVSRLARRLAAVDARALMQRDERPVVLYLRSFADDRLRIRSGSTERRSLVERLGPRRFDRFEEVVAWHLNDIGPVVAVNPPGVGLAPLGAARTTLDSGQWQGTIDEWMHRAELIVVAAPPAQPTPGLHWELEQIGRNDHWAKTVFVLPCVPDLVLRYRWAAFAPLLASVAPWAPYLPADPAIVLAGSVTPGSGWSLVTASERTEWSYAEALSRIISERPPAPATAQDPV